MIGFQNSLCNIYSAHCSGFSLIRFKKSSFRDRIFTVLLLYRCHQETFDRFYNQLCAIFIDNNYIDIIIGDVNVNLFKDSKSLQFSLDDFEQIVKHATHIDGGLKLTMFMLEKRYLKNFL